MADGTLWVQDLREHNLLIFQSEWAVRWAIEKNEGLELGEYTQMNEEE